MAPRSSWSECSVVVRKSFRLNQALAHSVPNKISFTEDDNHMLFLAGTSHSSLYAVNLDKDADVKAPEHQKVFDTQKSYVTLSKEEELSRERRRVSKQGLTTFEYSENVVLVPLGTNLYHNTFPQIISDETDAVQEPQLITSEDGSPYFDTKLCPTNCNIISFVKQDDIHITFVASKEQHRLTYLSKPGEISAGVPPFVIQEEFDRYTGYYWRPVQEDATTYHILFEKVYQRYVNMVTIPGSADGEPQVFRYPRAGQVNAFTTLAMVKFTIEDEKVSNLTCFRLQEELTTIFPWVEYIPWLGWHPSGSSVWAMLLDRRQKKMALIDIPLAYFKPNETFEGSEKRPNAATIRVLYSRNSDTWIDVSDNMYFFNSDPNKFIMLTEEKFAHLWCHTLSTEYDKASGAVALTKGEWSVTKLVGVDEARGIVYFHALVDPTQQHLYSVTADSEVKQLTTRGFYHSCVLNNAKDQFVTVYSNLNTHYACSIHSTTDGAKLRDITLPMDFRSVQLKKGEDANNVGITSYYYTPPILKTVNIDGDDIKCIIYPPKVDDLSKPCPVVLYVYGGPAIQLVVDRFRGIQHRQHNLFATLGYCVVIADCPGSANRGKVWAERLYKQMGVVEVDMQIKVLKDLATQHAFMDLERVAIIGTSYGGYISLMAMGQRSDFFKLSIAICPATSWLLYDTAYSERYMGLPTENQEGYTTSSVMHYVEDFPDEDNRVLIIHGLLDENVHFSHTTMLIDAMIAASKPYNLLVYPRERHGIGRGNAPEHCDTNIATFLRNHL